MSMYNRLFGVNPWTGAILHAIEIDIKKVERLRDSGVNYEDKKIWVYTRTGGGNRKESPNVELTGNKRYLYDEDDSFDKTYAIYYFKLDANLEELFKANNVSPSNPVDWEDYFKTFDPEKEMAKIPELVELFEKIAKS